MESFVLWLTDVGVTGYAQHVSDFFGNPFFKFLLFLWILHGVYERVKSRYFTSTSSKSYRFKGYFFKSFTKKRTNYYHLLLNACLGDHKKASRLVELAMIKNPSYTIDDGIKEAYRILMRDRGVMI